MSAGINSIWRQHRVNMFPGVHLHSYNEKLLILHFMKDAGVHFIIILQNLYEHSTHCLFYLRLD